MSRWRKAASGGGGFLAATGDTRRFHIAARSRLMKGKGARARARAALRAAADGSVTLTAEQVTTLTNIDYLADSLDEELDTLLDDLGIADPDEEGEPEEPADSNTNALRSRIRAAHRTGDRIGRARLQAEYRALPMAERRELITAERVDEHSGRSIVRVCSSPRAGGTQIARATSDPAAAADGQPQLFGHFAVFDTWTEIDSFWEGQFMESLAKGSFKNTMANDRANMRITLNHGRDPFLGNKVLARIDTLSEDQVGAYYEAALYRGLPELLMEGLRDDAYGASFRFYVMQEERTDKPKPSAYNPRGLPERVITEVMVEEFGPVTFPQYPEASAHLRSRSTSRSTAAAPKVRREISKGRDRNSWISSLARI